MDFMDISKMRITVRQFAPPPRGTGEDREDSESGPLVSHCGQRPTPTGAGSEYAGKSGQGAGVLYDKKYADLTHACDDKERGHNVYYYGSPLVLFVCYDRTACWHHPQSGESSGAIDATIVATHMMLEAASIGLGTVWISYFDAKKAKKMLELPESWEPVCMLYIGYPAADFQPNPHMTGKRFPLEHTCFWNQAPQG